MNFFFIISGFTWGIIALCAQPLSYTVDLRKTDDDRLKITGQWDSPGNDSILISFPSVVPGTYARYDFGRFASEMDLWNERGEKISFRKISQNQYGFRHKGKFFFSYKVEDSWDSRQNNIVFEPAGTNIEKDKNIVLNHHGIFAFLYGKEHLPLKITVYKPEGFYAATGLENVFSGVQTDTLYAESYHQLVDAPVMYCMPDTVNLKIENTQILIAGYSPNKKISSRFIARYLRPLLYAQRDYLGGTLPVNKYAFIFYFTDKQPLSGATGALEHNNSSFYFLYESDTSSVVQTIRDVCAHEFFHIITPLTIHSDEIRNFNYIHPSMSQHLWLYEGLTEYASHHSQLQGGITDIDQFLTVMLEKYENSQTLFNDTLPFTLLSKKVLYEPYHQQYSNVYEKGALINLCLDLTLLKLSGGTYSIKNLFRDLGKRFGKSKSFKDDSLFDIISSMTYPEIRTFFRKYVEGNHPLPFQECLRYAGIVFLKETKEMAFTLGSFDVDYNPQTQRLFVSDVTELDDFGKALGIKKGDELFSLNGVKFTGSFQDVETIQSHFQNLKEGDKVTLQVYRPKNKRRTKFNLVTLQAPARKVETIRKNVVHLDEPLSEEQKNILSAWTGISFR